MTEPFDTYVYINDTLGYSIRVVALSQSQLRWLITLQFLGQPEGPDIAYLQFEKRPPKATVLKLTRNAVRNYLKALTEDTKKSQFMESYTFVE